MLHDLVSGALSAYAMNSEICLIQDSNYDGLAILLTVWEDVGLLVYIICTGSDIYSPLYSSSLST